MTNPARWLARLGFAVFCLCAVSAMPAAAHGVLEQSTPSNGATLAAVPDEVTTTFTEPPIRKSVLKVFDPCGRRVDRGGVRIHGNTMTASVRASTAGRYRASYFLISEADGHPTDATFTFDVRRGESCAEAAPGEDRAGGTGTIWDIPIDDLLIALGFAAVIGAAGGHLYGSLLPPRD